MEGKIWGILLSILGIGGLIWALIYINGPEVSTHLPFLLAGGVCGAIAFFIGIWLIDHKRVADAKIQQTRSIQQPRS